MNPLEQDRTRLGTCPECETSALRTTNERQEFVYGRAPNAVTLSALVPVHECTNCGFIFTDEVAEGLRHDAVCEHLGVLKPRETTASEPIEGLKIIRLNSARIEESDDPSYPYKLEVNLRPPELVQVAFVMLYGGSEVMVLRGKTRDAIDQFIELNDLRHHPRLRRMTITGPDGLPEEIGR